MVQLIRDRLRELRMRKEMKQWYNMVLEHKSGLMETSMRVNLETVWLMGVEQWHTKMEMFIWENMFKINAMDMELTYIKMEKVQDMKESGWVINSMVKVPKN